MSALNKEIKELKEMIAEEEKNQSLQNLGPTKSIHYNLCKATQKLKIPQTSIPTIRTNERKCTRRPEEKAFANHLCRWGRETEEVQQGHVEKYQYLHLTCI